MSRITRLTDLLLSQVLNLLYGGLMCVMFPLLWWKGKTTGQAKLGWQQKWSGDLPQRVQAGANRVVWLHAVSVGEVLQLKQIIQELRSQEPHLQILISTTTTTGYQVAVEKFPDCQIGYFPFDFTWAVARALDRVQPDLIVLVELELWPNFVLETSRRGIPLVLINGRLSEKSFAGYRWIRPLMKRLLRRLQLIAVQTEEYAKRFVELGADPQTVVISGSIKFDGVQTDRLNPKTLELKNWLHLSDNDQVWIAGSTQDPEETIVAGIYQRLKPDFPKLRLVIVPRHPERGDSIAAMLQQHQFTVIRRSKHSATPSRSDETFTRLLTDSPVGLLDTVGELGACWGLADIAFVGGSFGDRGGQNMLEPAAYGAAVCYGPNTKNFRQIVEILESQQATRRVMTADELEGFVREMLNSPELALAYGAKARETVLQHRGATRSTVTLLLEILNQP